MFLFTKATPDRVVALPDGTPFHCLNARELRFLYDEIYGDCVYLKNGITVSEGDCVIDVGAHVGLFSLFLTQRYGDIDLYCIEPVPAAFGALLANAEEHFPLARCIPVALAERERRIQLTWFPHLSSRSTRHPEQPALRDYLRTHCALGNYPVLGPLARKAPRLFDLCTWPLFEQVEIDVDAATLSTVIAKEHISTIDLLKVDVEGSEVQVLMGIEPEDWRRIKQVVVKTTHSDLDAVVRALRINGFRITTDVSLGLRGTGYLHVYATR